MSFLTAEDETCTLDGVIVFPDCRDKHRYMLYEGNNVIMCGNADRGDNSFIVSSICEI